MKPAPPLKVVWNVVASGVSDVLKLSIVYRLHWPVFKMQFILFILINKNRYSVVSVHVREYLCASLQ